MLCYSSLLTCTCLPIVRSSLGQGILWSKIEQQQENRKKHNLDLWSLTHSATLFSAMARWATSHSSKGPSFYLSTHPSVQLSGSTTHSVSCCTKAKMQSSDSLILHCPSVSTAHSDVPVLHHPGSKQHWQEDLRCPIIPQSAGAKHQ